MVRAKAAVRMRGATAGCVLAVLSGGYLLVITSRDDGRGTMTEHFHRREAEKCRGFRLGHDAGSYSRAPARLSIDTASLRSAFLARNRAVSPNLFLAFTSAPAAINLRNISALESSAATIKAV